MCYNEERADGQPIEPVAVGALGTTARWVQRRVEYNVTPMARGPGRFILEMARRKGAGDFVGYGASSASVARATKEKAVSSDRRMEMCRQRTVES